jgi:hypothetical protein
MSVLIQILELECIGGSTLTVPGREIGLGNLGPHTHRKTL